MDISPVLDEATVIIGLLTPFVTALVAAASTRVREANDWVRGTVSVLAAAAAGVVISASQSAGLEAAEATDQATGILAVHLTTWLMVTQTAVGRFLETARGVLSR